MKSRALLKVLSVVVILLISFSAIAQNADEAYYNSALKSYVDKLLVRFGKSNMDRERFLVQQLRMINAEIKSRITGISQIKENYFDRLDNLKAEVQALRGRLQVSGSSSLDFFAGDVEKKIQDIIDSGSINYKRQKAIEDAVQLLHIAEEMVRLDPNASLESDPSFTKSLTKTQNKLTTSFGERANVVSTADGEEPTVYDLYKEWKRNELVKYQVRWADVQVIKRRLYSEASTTQKEQMFRRELLQASEAFNYGRYGLAERSFQEILDRYRDIGNLDDCLFFKGQSNYFLGRYNQARDDFSDFITSYPSSSYLSEVYLNLMQIAYHFEDYNEVISLYRDMRSLLSSSDPDIYKMTFMAAVSALKDQQYERCIEFAFEVPANSELYREARYVMAEAYTGAGNYEESRNVFEAIIAGKDVEPEFRFTVLLKLGYLSYEIEDYFNALKYFDQIAGTFSEYDRVLIGYSWTLYKMELGKESASERDYTETQKYLETLIDNFYGSDYLLEARTLYGYVMQLQEKVDAAIDNFEFVFNSREVKQISDSLNTEYDRMNVAMGEARKTQTVALQKNNPDAFKQAQATIKRLRTPLNRLSYMDMSSSGVAVNSEISRLKKQLDELDRLKIKAEELGNKKLIDRIETMQLKIYRVVNSIAVTGESALGVNYFDGHPLARKESVVEHNNQKIMQLRQDTQQQRQDVAAQIAGLDMQIQAMREQKDYRKMIQLELRKEYLLDLSKKLDLLATRAHASEKMTSKIDLAYWSNYGAFGMTNVRFAIRNLKSDEIASFQLQIEQINDFLELRKRSIEHKIDQIDDQITLMTRQVRRQERIREREELKRQFEESYFDTHDSELNYDQGTTEPPKLIDEEE